MVEGMTEQELAIFDLLTKPEPILTADQLVVVRASAKRLLQHLQDKLVLDLAPQGRCISGREN